MASGKQLQLHRYKKQYRGHSGTWEKDFVADFFFSIRDDSGAVSEPFWCEVRLRENLATRPGWAELSSDDRFKALVLFAADAIGKAGGRPIRHMSLGWFPQVPYADGPCWDLSTVDLKHRRPIPITGEGVQPVVLDQH